MKRFKKVYIEITNVCNLRCNFCPITKRTPKFMSLEDFSLVLNKVKDFTDYIYLHLKGEPLYHPDLGLFLDLAYEYGLKVNLTTNGTLISKNKDLLLNKPSLRQINISLHSIEQNQRFNNQEEYIDEIISFIDQAKEERVIVALRLWNLTDKIEENIIKNKFMLEKLESHFGLDYNLIDEFSKRRGIKIRDRLYLNEDMEFVWPDIDNDYYEESGFCYGLRDQLGILVDGTVVPCCLDGEGIINLGNIYNEDLEMILDKEVSHKIFDGFSNRKAYAELCKRCTYKNKFDYKEEI